MSNTDPKADLNESIPEPFKEIYSKDVSMIVARNATDHSNTFNVTTQLKLQDLTATHEAIDEKVGIVQKRIEESDKGIKSLNRERYKANELENQALLRFERMGLMFTALNSEKDKLKSQSVNHNEKLLKYSLKEQKVNVSKLETDELKNKINSLEFEIRNVLDAPEPFISQDLILENAEIEAKLQQFKQEQEIRKMKKLKINELKNEKWIIGQEVWKAKEKINANKQMLLEINKLIDNVKNEFISNQTIMEKELDNKTKAREQLEEAIQNSIENIRECEKESEATKEVINNVELEIKNLNKNIMELDEEIINENNNLEGEIGKLRVIEQKRQDIIYENEQIPKAICEQSNTLVNLLAIKDELAKELLSKTTELSKLEQEQDDQRTQIDILLKKSEKETEIIEELKEKEQAVNNQLLQINKELSDLSLALEAQRTQIINTYKEKSERITDQMNLEHASAELRQLRLTENNNKINYLNMEINELNGIIQWQEIRAQVRTKTVARLQAKKSQKNTFKENSKIEEKVEKKNEIPVIDLSVSIEETNYKPAKVDCTPFHPPKSPPGILKSPHKKCIKEQQSPNKRVTFEGLSSTTCSSNSIISNETSHKKGSQEPDIDDILKEWVSQTSGTCSTRQK